MLCPWNIIRRYDKTLEEFAGYVEKLEQAAKFTKLQMSATSGSNTSSGKKKRKERSKENETTGLHKCKYCKKMVTHDDDDCWEKPGNEKLVKPRWAKHVRIAEKSSKSSSSSDKKKKTTPTFTADQLNFLIHNAHLAAGKGKKTKSIKKRKILYKRHSESESDSAEEGHIIEKMSEVVDSDEMSNYSSDSDEEYFVTSVFNHRTKKKRKIGQLTTEVVGEIVDCDQKITPIRCLLDTGTTSCIILKPFVTRMSKYKHSSTKWRTMGGTFKTKWKA